VVAVAAVLVVRAVRRHRDQEAAPKESVG
jgi:hypothetical protein